MFEKPKDIPGECNARLYLGDDYGDNSTTMRCQLPEGHDGVHQETFSRDDTPVVITWHIDESYHCPKHGHVSDWGGDDRCWDCLQELPDCQSCGGLGFKPARDNATCTACNGLGKNKEQ